MTIAHELSSAQLGIVPADELLKVFQRLFKAPTELARTLDKRKEAPSGSHQILFTDVAENLDPSFFITYITSGTGDGLEATKGQIRKELHLVPKVVFAVEEFELAVRKMSKKHSLDLERYLKRRSARDFKINRHTVLRKISEKTRSSKGGKSKRKRARAEDSEETEDDSGGDDEGDGDEPGHSRNVPLLEP